MIIDVDKDEIKSIIRDEIQNCVYSCVHEMLGYELLKSGGYRRCGIPNETAIVIKGVVQEIINKEVISFVKKIVSDMTPSTLAYFIAEEFRKRLEGYNNND